MPTQQQSTGGTIASTAGAAAGTAIAPGIGTAIGAAVGNIVGGLFGGSGGTTFAQASTEIHQWFRNHAPQVFLDWMKSRYPKGFTSLDAVKSLYWVWRLEYEGGRIYGLDNPNHMIQPFERMQSLFGDMGIDLAASMEKSATNPAHLDRYHVSPEDVVRKAPSAATVEELARIQDKRESGAPLSPSERQAAKGLDEAAGGKPKSGEGFSLGMAVPIVIAALVLVLILRK